MALLTSNNVKKLISSPVNPADLTITLLDVIGLPDVSDPSDFTVLTLIRLSDGQQEIVRVDDITGNVLTVQRAQEGTSALSFAGSDEARNFFTSGMFQETSAVTNRAAAEAAQVAAELAQTGAEAAETGAETAEIGAEAAQAAAEAAAGSVSGGRLVKKLLTSGTLTINEAADASDPAYLTSTDIHSGTYLVYAYGAGSGGSAGELVTTRRAGGGGGGGGGVSRDILDITVNTAFTIGAGGAGGSANNLGSDGGDTIISTITGGGATTPGSALRQAGSGGVGTLYDGQDGGLGHLLDSTSVGTYGGTGGGPSGGGRGGSGGLASGGSGGLMNTSPGSNPGGDGGDGYIEIYEWS